MNKSSSPLSPHFRSQSPHYLRRRTNRVYAAQGDALLKQLRARAANVAIAGMAVVLPLPDGAPDRAIAGQAASLGPAPAPLSLWYASAASVRPGLLLGVATSAQKRIEASCAQLFGIIDRLT